MSDPVEPVDGPAGTGAVQEVKRSPLSGAPLPRGASLWKPGQSGNPAGSSQTQRFRAAVRRRLQRSIRDGDLDELDQLADEVIECAKSKSQTAPPMLKELWAREDGPLETRLAGADGGSIPVHVVMHLHDASAPSPADPPGSDDPVEGSTLAQAPQE